VRRFEQIAGCVTVAAVARFPRSKNGARTVNARFGHLQININKGNLPYYRDLFAFLEWPTVYEGDGMLGVGGKADDSLWFLEVANGASNDYDGAGVNHIGIAVSTQAEVDQAVAYLAGKGIESLFETPRHRPDFASSETETYYQVMFKSPDNILFEIVYTGPKQ